MGKTSRLLLDNKTAIADDGITIGKLNGIVAAMVESESGSKKSRNAIASDKETESAISSESLILAK